MPNKNAYYTGYCAAVNFTSETGDFEEQKNRTWGHIVKIMEVNGIPEERLLLLDLHNRIIVIDREAVSGS